ncbi:MAG TPA: helix-turn-helix domain-containing protein [Roseiarcus sp.]|nr:helix-turn-helix domain-containing protein [Roseiarcus sp.]
MPRLRQAFLDHGYEQLTMIGLAKACDLSRRALYHHVRSKEDAFRAMLRWRHSREIEAGIEAGERRIAGGASAVEAIAAVFDARYGEARRDLERSPHALEINREAFHRCHDVMSESAAAFQARLAAFLGELENRNLLRLKPGADFAQVAQLLADGARGVNQTLPLRSSFDLAERYLSMCEALFYGCAEPPRRREGV